MSNLQAQIASLEALVAKANALPTEKKIQESKAVTPSTSAQTVQPDSGYDGLGKVTVNAMPTGSVGTPSISIDANGKITATAAVDAGYVDGTDKTGTKTMTTQAAKTVTPTKSSQTAVAKNVYTTGVVTVGAIPPQYVDTTDANAVAAHILEGDTAYVDGVKVTGTMPQRIADDEATTRVELDPNGAELYVMLPEGHYNEQEFYYKGKDLTATPTKDTQYISKGLYSKVTVNPIPDKYQDVSGVTATAATTLAGSKFVNSSGVLTTGTMANNGATSKTIDGLETKSATIPAGYTTGGTVALDGTIDNTANAQATKIAEIAALLEGKAGGSGSGASVETCTVTINGSSSTYRPYYISATVVDETGAVTTHTVSENSSTSVTISNVVCGSVVTVYFYSIKTVLNIMCNGATRSVYSDKYFNAFQITASAGETAVITNSGTTSGGGSV